MLWTLIKKELIQSFRFFFMDIKRNKKRSVLGIIGMVVIMGIAYVSFALMLFGIASVLADVFVLSGFMAPTAGHIYYFTMMGVITLAMAIVGSVFTTYSILYMAKDNEMMLSLPIPNSYILISRMVSVYLQALIFVAMGWIPTIIAFMVRRFPTVPLLINWILLLFIMALFVTAVISALGWGIAWITSKLPSNSFVTVLISILFFAVYYSICFNMDSVINALVNQTETLVENIRIYANVLYQLGKAGSGELSGMVLFTACTAGLFAICLYFMSMSFHKILTVRKVAIVSKKKTVDIKTSSADKALFHKELKMFTSNATWMLNNGLGVVISFGIAGYALVKRDSAMMVLMSIREELPFITSSLILLPITLMVMITSMDCIIVPSISLEGNTFWTLKVLPVSEKAVFNAKKKLHILINLIPALCLTLSLAYVLEAELTQMILAGVFTVVYVYFTASFGLMLALWKPNFEWTSVAAPVKQSVSVLIAIFTGYAVGIAIVALYFILVYKVGLAMTITGYLASMIIVFALLYKLCELWLNTKGTIRLRTL